ncbi:MAG TPA: glycogen debranching protein GlgX, partial [Cyclobacteriaceae bacterium]|nr:glycogen debranching protein GlgX [Cyclobacteriaceae bacterium]
MNGDISIYPGEPYPLGATYTGDGTNFAIFSENATAVYLCLFDRPGPEGKERRIKMPERTHQVWHVCIPEVKPGQLYGYRVEGAYDPGNGHRFNSNKLLLDPYARAVTNTLEWNDALFGYEIGHEDGDLSMSKTNSAPYICLCVVVDNSFDWEGDELQRIPLHKTMIYETHVRGFTLNHPEIPENIRGTYKGLAHPVALKYLTDLGVTSVELMPVHHFVKDRHLVEKKLSNYWGYNTISFFAPEPSYAQPQSFENVIKEFKEMVKALHKAGLEVILDVVYNHTAEGNERGPTLSFRGIDNKAYYRLAKECRYYQDYTGTGNTLNATMPYVLQLMMDSLRYWVTEMHVDGFRFDLAAALARELQDVNRLSAFFEIIQQDPILSRVKLIAEPWDIGEGGYMVGKFPAGWLEWNGKYRDCVRDYWRGEGCTLGDLALRITGSPDLYSGDYRSPTASVNFITAHDGFTLQDLVSYNEKHNEANGENNNDGENHNRSWNCGVEGETDDPDILKLRAQQKRNLLVTMFLSQGVPMLTAGDEIGKTQKGNNNAYCQDNEISWIDWEHADNDLREFVRSLINFRQTHPVFSRRKWFQGKSVKRRGLTDIQWFQPSGEQMSDEEWQVKWSKSLAIHLNGHSIELRGPHGEAITDDSFYVMFNAYHEPVEFQLLPG